MKNENLELENLKKALTAWDPNDYDVWLHVGMALKAAGYDFDVWNEWSRGSGKYYDAGNDELMRRKWDSFSDATRPGDFTVKTIFWKAWREGMKLPREAENVPFERQVIRCDGYIAKCYKKGTETIPGIDFTQTDGDSYLHLPAWLQCLVFLKTVFLPGDIAAVANGKFSGLEDEKWGPRYGNTVDVRKICAALELHAGDVDAVSKVLGPFNETAGGWITFNAVDGNGFKSENAASFRLALIESDKMTPEETIEKCVFWRLPIACVTSSGGKSAHVLVKIDAPDFETYRKRTNFLYKFLKAQGMDLDPQDKNVLRFTRLPGVMRGDNEQSLRLVGQMLPTCCKSYEEWEEYAKEAAAAAAEAAELEKKELPTLPLMHTQAKRSTPAPDSELIEGVMLKGGVMEVIAPPKAGKTHFLMQMGMSMAQGLPFLGYKMARSKVLYANMELSRKQFERRMFKLKNAMFDGENDAIKYDDAGNFIDTPLKGMGLTLNTFTDAVLQQCGDAGFDVIIIDPIYPLMDGDENGTQAWRAAIKELDRLSRKMGDDATIIYVHHTTKGDQGAKNVRDQGAGSGIQARHGDEIVTLSELYVSDELREELQWDAKVKAYRLAFTSRDFDPDPKCIYFRDGLFYDDANGVLNACPVIGSPEYQALMSALGKPSVKAVKKNAAAEKKAEKKAQEAAMIDAMTNILTAHPNGMTASEIAGEMLNLPEYETETLANLRIAISSFATAYSGKFTKETNEHNQVIITLKKGGKK